MTLLQRLGIALPTMLATMYVNLNGRLDPEFTNTVIAFLGNGGVQL